MKKLFALLLALTLALSLGAVAFAAEADLTGHTYKTYQIFKGTQAADNAKLADIEWGEGISSDAFLSALQSNTKFNVKVDNVTSNAFANAKTAADVAEVLSKYADDSDFAKAFAQVADDNLGTGIDYVEDQVLDAGYYLVVDVTTNPTPSVGEDGEETGTNFVTNLSLLQLTQKGSFEIRNKVDVPEVDKAIRVANGETFDKVNVNAASIGDVVTYEITGTMPTNLSDYNKYYYEFNDTLTKGLDYNEDAKVYLVNSGENGYPDAVSGTEITSYFNITASGYSAENDTSITITPKSGDVKTINGLTKDSHIVVIYTATLNENAVIAGPNPNTVDLKYSNNPNKSGDGEPGTENNPVGKTPESKVNTYTTELTILKTDENKKPLAGAEFTLTGTDVLNVVKVTGEVYKLSTDTTKAIYWKLTNGTYTTDNPETEGMDKTKYASTTDKYEKVTEEWFETQKSENPDTAKAFVDANGKVTFTGLGAGTYTLTESVTPAGYNTIDPITFTVSFDDGEFSNPDEDSPIQINEENTLEGTIVNQSGTVLPETGGIGTTIFYVVGAVLVAGAAIVLFARKRAEE